MTAACGGGTSAPKLGTAAVVDYSAGLLAVLLDDFATGWLIPVIPLFGLAPLVLNTFCASDPPAVPTFTQAEVNAILQLDLGPDFDSGIVKAKDWALNTIWNDACHCTSGTYTPPTPPVQPANSITPVGPPAQLTGPCRTHVPSQGNNDMSGNVDCVDTFQFQWRDQYLNYIRVDQVPMETGDHKIIDLVPPTQTVDLIMHPTPQQPCTNLTNLVDLMPAGATLVRLELQSVYDSTRNLTHRDVKNVTWYCGGLPGAPQQPCCPPDTSTQSYLDNILQLLVAMQRNYAPFAYNKGAVHAGLTGDGTFAISRLIGVQVTITTIPPTSSTMPGNPLYVRDLGWISASEVDGMIEERRVSQQQFTWFPRLMPLADHLNFSFTAGTQATITELVAEP